MADDMPRVHLDDLTDWFARAASKSLPDQLAAAYLRGSAARGDNIRGVSDVDFYIVLHNNSSIDPSSKQILSQSLRSLIQEANRRWASEKPSFRVVPMSYFEQNKVGSYLTSLDSRILLGSDVLAGVARPTTSELSQFGLEEFKRFSDFWRQLEGNEADFRSLSDIAACKQYVVLKLAQTALFSRGVAALRKQEISNAFGKEFAGLNLGDVVEKAQELRENGSERSLDSELRYFIDETDEFHRVLRQNLTSKTRIYP